MLFFELLQVALGNRECLCSIPSDKEWLDLYDESERQAVTGILLQGIERLSAEQRPSQEILLQWIGVGQMIEQQNHQMDERCVELISRFNEAGLHGTILKGQGVSLLYDKDLRSQRQSGDIDVYANCGIKKALAFAKSQGLNNIEWDYKHLHLNLWDDTEVEMHYRVEVLLNLWKNRKLQKWFRENDALLYSENDGLTTPTLVFNVFYILLHIYRHFLYEGVGLRQIVDYYFVLKTVKKGNIDVGYSLDAVSQFGLERFAKGLMWVMQEVLGMTRERMLWEPDEKEGKFILAQVMKDGNFGHHNADRNRIGGKWGTFVNICTHNYHLFSHYPSDTIWAPFYFLWLQLWKILQRLKGLL